MRFGKAYDSDDAAALCCDLLDVLQAGSSKGWFQQQVFRRITRNGHLWKYHQSCTGVPSPLNVFRDFSSVAAQVSDGTVYLR